MSILSSLNREQKEAVGLLQIGTFLEYFDLMLYVHMAVLLNELFFPKTDPHTAALIAAFAFCSTYVLRPFGALFFGWIGDHIGRKTTVIITTTIMAFSCIVMANVPTYAQIGIAAAWVVTGCRIFQGLSSMGEIMGAIIYLTEITKPPAQYPTVALVALSSSLGAMCALGVATLVTHCGFNWRIAFWTGACIAVVGASARTRLRETPEFVDMKRKKQLEFERICKSSGRKKEFLEKTSRILARSKTPTKNILAYFCVECSYALMFYLIFIYCNPILRSFGYSAEDIISHNLILSVCAVLFNMIVVYLVMYIHPLTIISFRSKLYCGLILLMPIVISQSFSPYHIFCLQFLLSIARGGATPADSILIRGIKIEKRFTIITSNYAVSRAIVHVISAFGLVYLTEWIGYWGVWVIGLPVAVGYLWGVRHFEKLEGLGSDKTSAQPNNEVHSHAA